MNLYKVVHKDRRSLMATGKYCLEYRDGEVVNALSGTLGLMLFGNIDTAKNFASSNFFTKNDYMIIVVSPLNDVSEKQSICNFTYEKDLDEYYKLDDLGNEPIWVGDKYIFNIQTPPGTVFCNSVLVIGEYI